MSRTAVRWIAIALVGALVAALGVSLVTGGGDDDEPVAADGTEGGVATGPTAPGEVLDGPHLYLDLCAGVTCPALDEAGQQDLVDDIEADPRVASVLLVTSEQAYRLFLDRYGDDTELVESVRPEDVPARIEVDLLDPSRVPEVMDDYSTRDGVASAHDARRVAP